MIYALALACVVETRVCLWSGAEPFPTQAACEAEVDAISAEARRLAASLGRVHGPQVRWWSFCGRLDQIRRVVPAAYAGEEHA